MLLHLGESLAQNVMSLVASLHSSSLDINTVYLFIYFMVYATFSFTKLIVANTQNSLRRIDCQMCRKSSSKCMCKVKVAKQQKQNKGT